MQLPMIYKLPLPCFETSTDPVIVKSIHYQTSLLITYSTGRRSYPSDFSSTTNGEVDGALKADSWSKSSRYLTGEEFDYPYFALEKFAHKHGWEAVLQELMEYALMNSSIDRVHSVDEVMMWRDSMMGHQSY